MAFKRLTINTLAEGNKQKRNTNNHLTTTTTKKDNPPTPLKMDQQQRKKIARACTYVGSHEEQAPVAAIGQQQHHQL